MDRYYACSLTNKNIVECVPLTFHHVVNIDRRLLYNVYGELPICLDPLFLMRKFSMPVKIVRGRNP